MKLNIYMIVSRKKVVVVLLVFFTCWAGKAQEAGGENSAPQVLIKTNLLHDVTSTLNAGVELGLNERFSLDLPFSYNPWKWGNDRYWKHFLVQPELRYWKKHQPSGHFFGVHAHYGVYNVSRLPDFIFSDDMASHRFEGWLVGAGVSYGYRWRIAPRWNLEATLGLGYAYVDYDKYSLGACAEKSAFGTYNYFGPTRAGVSLSFTLGGKAASRKGRGVAHSTRSTDTVGYYPPVVSVKEEPVEKKEEPVCDVTARKDLSVRYVTPAVEPEKRRSKRGTAYLDFEQGSANIDYSFGNNSMELRKIHDLVESVQDDPYTSITRIALVGHASPEGVAADNMLLSARRSASLKNHIKVLHSFPETLFTVDGRGEDWRTIDSVVAASKNIERYMILEIIRGTADGDQREYRLREEWPGFYQRLRDEIYPRLRRTDYEINYTVLPFTAEIASEQFRRDPSGLSLNEMFMIAKGYEPGSAAFNEIFETAARLFPDSDEANINAAANALSREDTVAAALYLSKVRKQDEAYHHNLGVLKALTIKNEE